MKRLFSLILAAGLLLSVTGCSPKEERVIPGTYASVSLYQMSDYVLNENGSYDHGEEKGTYTAAEETYDLTMTPKGADAVTLKASGVYYYDDRYYMAEDTEYGMAPTFDEEGKSDQTFTTKIGETDLTLALTKDGNFTFTTSVTSPEYFRVKDTLSYEGTYTLEDTVLHLNWQNQDFPFLFVEEKIYVVVYEQQNEENAAALDARKTALTQVAQTAAQGRWWTKVDDARSTEIIQLMQGDWEYQEDGQYGLNYKLSVSDDYVFVTVTLLGYPAKNQGDFIVCNDVILIHYDQGTQGHICIPYTYENGELKLYPINDLTDEATLDPAMQFITDDNIANGPWFTKVS